MVAAVAGATAVAGVASSAISSDAASSAANKQAKAADKAQDALDAQYQNNQTNLQPYMDAGGTGLNALLYRLGLSGGGAGGPGGGQQLIADQIRANLTPQFTTQGAAGGPPSTDTLPAQVRQAIATGGGTYGYDAQTGKYGFQYQQNEGGDNGSSRSAWYYTDQQPGTAGGVDQAGLDAAVQAQLSAQQQTANDPTYGSLLAQYKPYEEYGDYQPYKEYTAPTAEDFTADPGYEFRLQQGQNALLNASAAAGGLNSGRAAKSLIDYNSGQASQEYGNFYNRYTNDYTTGLNSHVTNYNTGLAGHVQDYNAGFNAFNTQNTDTYNKLAGIAGIGQNAAGQLAGVNQAYGAQTASNQLSAGNSAAAGDLAQAKATNQGIGAVTNAATSYLAPTSGISSFGTNAATTPAFQNTNSLYGWANGATY